MKADVLTIPKMWYFLRFEGFEPELSAVKVKSIFKKKKLQKRDVTKKDTASIFLKTLFLLREVSKLDFKNTSFESLCPKLFREHVKNVGTSKNYFMDPAKRQIFWGDMNNFRSTDIFDTFSEKLWA